MRSRVVLERERSLVYAAWEETQAAACTLGFLLHSQDVRGPQDFEGAFARTA